MRRAMTLPGSASLSALTILLMTLLPADGFGQEACSGHKLLPKPRPEASCRNVAPQIFVSPDKTLRAFNVEDPQSLRVVLNEVFK